MNKIDNIEFYDLLLQNVEFKNQLGEAMLLSGKLETVLTKVLKQHDIELTKKKQTLGTIIDRLQKENILDINIIQALGMLKNQRNYLAHSIFGELDEFFEDDGISTKLPTENLIEADTQTYSEKIWEFNKNVLGMIDIFEKMLKK